jgi:hypothetical protein
MTVAPPTRTPPTRSQRILRLVIVGFGMGIVLIIAAAISGVGGFFVWVGVFGLIVGVVALAATNPERILKFSRRASVIVLIGSLVVLIIGASVPHASATTDQAEAPAHHGQVSAPSVTPTPTPTPTPTAIVGTTTSQEASASGTLLQQQGFVVVYVDATGAPVASPTGWTVSSETPNGGTPAAIGSTVTLTVAAPAPPPPPPAPAAPAAPVNPTGATAQCRDGSLSYSAHRQGTCSYHGGVAVWY